MTDKQIDEVYARYEQMFGTPLSFPPLDYGQAPITTAELVDFGIKALESGKPISWQDVLAPLSGGALS